MSYGNRSKEYDWFKGNNQDKGKSPKARAKTIWRFTKIFLMFSLFFFSMWGCVQVFIVKTNNNVGDGVEFYNSEDEIAPHVTEFRKREVIGAPGIYTIEPTRTNVWLNKYDSKDELMSAQKILTSDDGNVTHKMSDAMKGKNEYTRFVDKDGNLIDKKSVITMSSEQKHYKGTGAPGKTFTAHVGRQTYNFIIPKESTAPNDLIAERAKFAIAVLNQANEITKSAGMQAGLLKTQLKEVLSTNKLNFPKYQKLVQAQKNILATLGSYLGFDEKVWLNSDTDPLTLDGKPLVSGSTYYNTVANKWKTYTAGSPGTWANAPGGNVDGKPVAAGDLPPSTTTVYVHGAVFGKSHYRPIITWGQAWKRGVGPFYGLFVWPISKMAVAITSGMGMHGGWESLFAIVIIVFILRILAFGLTFKSVLQQTKQQEMQAKKAVIDAKYESYKGNKQMEARKRQETSELYKKEGISPLGALGTVFITMPIFLSIWRVIGGVPHLKSTIWLGINFSATSYKELFKGEFQYLPLILLAGASAALSQLYPRLLTKRRDKNRINVHQKAALKKNNKTQNIILVVYMIMAVIFSAGIQIYWIVGAVWQVIQTTITHHIIVRSKKKAKNRVKV